MWQILGLILAGSILAYLRWTSPEQEKKRRAKELQKLEKEYKKVQEERDALLAKKAPHSSADVLALASIIDELIRLRKEIRNHQRY